MRLKGKVAFITGAAQGIGEAIARLFAKEGARVIICDVKDHLGEKVAGEIPGSRYISLDVSNEEAWKEAFKKVGAIDILVNNAGVIGALEDLGPQDPEHASLEAWHFVHRINLDSVFLGCKYAIQAMKAKGGVIVNVSSRSGMVGVPHLAAYASSKAAVRNHTKTVALYCAEKKYPIRCNSLHPAAIRTPLWDPLFAKQGKGEEQLAEKIPMGHMGDVEDVAEGALYFASDASKFVTGSELVIDGGILAGSTSSPGNQGK